MILTGLLGYLSCALAAKLATVRQAADKRVMPSRFISRFLSLLLSLSVETRGAPLMLGRIFCGKPVPTFPENAPVSRRLDAVQAVRGILHGEEHHVAVRRRLARMDDVRRDVDHLAGRRPHVLVTD